MRRQRGKMAAIAVGVTIALLAAAFFRLQLLSGDQYTLRSEENRLRAISLPAPRGTIYDRNGLVIAENVPGYVVSVLPGRRDTIASTLKRLAGHLDLSRERVDELIATNRARPNESLEVLDDASFAQVTFIEERRPQFRRVVVEPRPQRRYPNGPAVAHIIGYVGQISPLELENPRYEGYEAGRTIGKDGLEAQYEPLLAGDRGVRYVEVNALGSVVRDFDVGRGQPAMPGNDLQLGIDLELQVMADSIFPEGMRGAIVAIDPANGEVIVAYSHPTFDPNGFIGGIPTSLWNSLRDDPDKPMLNRVSTATYPPGSTWKLVMSTIGMKTQTLTIDTRHQHACAGSLRYGNRAFRCWKSSGHGSLDLSGAIKNSCNVYFYQVGQGIGLDPLMAGVEALGFGERTGIDLPFEMAGRFPQSRDYFDQQYGPRGWTESVVWNLSIGQGENDQTLLGLARFYAALATGESPVRPHFARYENLAEQRVDWDLDLPEARRIELVDAMARVVNEPGGTAYGNRLQKWTLAGKTGTAQNPHGAPHSVFLGFAPAYDPRVVVAAIVEQGHPDGRPSLAVPLASRIVNRYLESIGIPPEETPGQRPVISAPAGVVVTAPEVISP